MTDIPAEQLYRVLNGKNVILSKTTQPLAQQWVEKLGRVLVSLPEGVFVQFAKPEQPGVDPLPICFFEFDGATFFDTIPPGFAKFDPVTRDSAVLDVTANEFTTMGAMYAPYFDQQPATPPTPATPPAPLPPGEKDWAVEFQGGVVFYCAATDSLDPKLRRCVGFYFQSVQATQKGVLAMPEERSGLTEAIYFPFDGETTLNWPAPAGTYRFATGLTAGQQVYNPQTASYTTVETFYPSVLDIAVTAALTAAWLEPVYYYPTVVPMGYAYDPFWGGYGYDYGYGYGGGVVIW